MSHCTQFIRSSSISTTTQYSNISFSSAFFPFFFFFFFVPPSGSASDQGGASVQGDEGFCVQDHRRQRADADGGADCGHLPRLLRGGQHGSGGLPSAQARLRAHRLGAVQGLLPRESISVSSAGTTGFNLREIHLPIFVRTFF